MKRFYKHKHKHDYKMLSQQGKSSVKVCVPQWHLVASFRHHSLMPSKLCEQTVFRFVANAVNMPSPRQP